MSNDEGSRATPACEAEKQASALPLRDEVVVWRGVKATPTAVLVDYIVVGNEMEKALIEETARRRRAEILLAATQQAYARDHEAISTPSETATTSNPQNGGKATPSAGTPINLEGHVGDADYVSATIAAGITRAAAAAALHITINNIERFHAGEERLEPDPDGPWVRFSDAAAISNRLASSTPSATAPMNFDPSRDVACTKGEYAQLVYDARRYEWLRDNMRRMPMGQIGQRHFFDQPGTMSFQEAVDDAMATATKNAADRTNDRG